MLNEVKYDGYRVQLHASGGRTTVYTRDGLEWTKRFSGVERAFDISGKPSSTARRFIEDGRTNFSEIRAELAGNKQGASSTTHSICSTRRLRRARYSSD